jgi:hypothetical protein
MRILAAGGKKLSQNDIPGQFRDTPATQMFQTGKNNINYFLTR